MLSLLLLLVTTQVPAVPGEGTLVSFCKQGRLSACEALATSEPKLAAELQAELAKSALRLEVQKAAEAEVSEEKSSDEVSAEAEDSETSSAYKGQIHHVISWRIFKELKDHKTLGGLYKPKDKRFEAKAKDKESHCGYQTWHREVDEEVIEWLRARDKATPEQFMKFLREIYNRPEMRKRFPNGF